MDRINLGFGRALERKIVGKLIRFALTSRYLSQSRANNWISELLMAPLTYSRIMEIPLCLHYLDLKSDDFVIDIGSPKNLAFYLLLNGHSGLVVSDKSDYFVSDFESACRTMLTKARACVFDATEPFPDFGRVPNKVFSISVLEHIPDGGDLKAMTEILKSIDSEGVLVITVPVSNEYFEEWTTKRHYWHDDVGGKSKVFYQRRYDQKALETLVSSAGGAIVDLLLIAEHPIRPIRLDDGMLMHNHYLIGELALTKLLNRIRFPFRRYISDHIASRRFHYLTKNWSDPNIRQAVVKITR